MNICPTSQDPLRDDGGEPIQQNEQDQLSQPAKGWGHIWETLVRMGLGESTIRIGTGLFSVVLVSDSRLGDERFLPGRPGSAIYTRSSSSCILANSDTRRTNARVCCFSVD